MCSGREQYTAFDEMGRNRWLYWLVVVGPAFPESGELAVTAGG